MTARRYCLVFARIDMKQGYAPLLQFNEGGQSCQSAPHPITSWHFILKSKD